MFGSGKVLFLLWKCQALPHLPLVRTHGQVVPYYATGRPDGFEAKKSKQSSKKASKKPHVPYGRGRQQYDGQSRAEHNPAASYEDRRAFDDKRVALSSTLKSPQRIQSQ